MKKILFEIILTVTLVTQFSNLSYAQLEEAFNAHGGANNFKRQGTLEYDSKMEVEGVFILEDHQLIDLYSRKILITNDSYKIGFDGTEVWITPSVEALGIPPRFYASTPFYFFGLPFLFADPGANLEALGTKELDGKKYNAVKVTYDPGTGDTPDDKYVGYFDRDTNQLKVLHYTVTYPSLTKGKTTAELEHAAVYEEWQNVNGLIVPKKIAFHELSNDNPSDTPVGSLSFENVSFHHQPPAPSTFHKPKGAQIDNSHKAK